MGEPGAAAEGQGPNPPAEFVRKMGVDFPSFTQSQPKAPEALASEAFKSGDVESFVRHAREITTPLSPEAHQLMENVNFMHGAVGVVDGLSQWAITTGDRKVAKLLTEDGLNIVRNLTKDPSKVLEAVAALTEEDVEAFTKKAEDAGIIRVDRSKEPPTEKAASSATEPPTTTAK